MIIDNKENYIDMMVELVQALGYKDVKQNSEDSPISITAKKDGKLYGFVCRYAIDAIKEKEMEEFIDACAKAKIDVPVYMTNSSFASSAKKAAEASGVQLWDRNYIDRIAIGVDVCFDRREPKRDSHKTFYIAATMVVTLILAAAMLVYFNPTLFGFLK